MTKSTTEEVTRHEMRNVTIVDGARVVHNGPLRIETLKAIQTLINAVSKSPWGMAMTKPTEATLRGPINGPYGMPNTERAIINLPTEVPLPPLPAIGLTADQLIAIAKWAHGYGQACRAAGAADLKKVNAQAEHFERLWYLRGHELESAKAAGAAEERERIIAMTDEQMLVWVVNPTCVDYQLNPPTDFYNEIKLCEFVRRLLRAQETAPAAGASDE